MTDSSNDADVPEDVPAIPRRRLLRPRNILLLALFVAVAGLLLAPTILSRSGLHHSLAKRLTAGTNWNIEVGEMDISWLGQSTLRDTVIADDAGNTLATIPHVESTHGLLKLLQGDCGEIEMHQPELNLTVWEGGSSLEEFLDEFSSPSSGMSPSYLLNVHDATVRISQRETHARTVFEKLNLVHSSGKKTPTFDLQTRLVSAPLTDSPIDDTGRLRIMRETVSPTVSPTESSASRETFRIVAQDVDLSRLETIARRFVSDAQLIGRISTDLAIDWPSTKSHSVLLRGELSGTGLDISSASRLKSDHFQIEQLQALGRIDLDGNNVRFDNVRIESDVLKLRANGDAGLIALTKLKTDVANRSNEASRSELNAESAHYQNPLNIDAKIDLARIAAMLPTTLNLKQGLTIQSGELSVRAAAKNTGGTQRLTANIVSTPLTGEIDHQPIVWDAPFRARVNASLDPIAGMRLDNVACDSSFFGFHVLPTESGYDIDGRCELDHLTKELAAFSDFSGIPPAGRVQLKAKIDTPSDNSFNLAGTLSSAGIRWSPGSVNSAGLEPMSARFSASGTSTGLFPQSLDAFEFDMTAAGDEFRLVQVQPFEFPLSQDSTCEFKANARGNLATWQDRLAMFSNSVSQSDTTQAATVSNLSLRGTGRLTATVRITPQAILFDNGQAQFDRLIIQQGNTVFIDPLVDGQFAFAYDQQTGDMTFRNTKLDGRFSSLETRNLVVSAPVDGAQAQIEGSVHLHSKLRQSVRSALTPRRQPMEGKLQAELRMAKNSAKPQFELHGNVFDFTMNDEFNRPQWNDSEIRFQSAGGWNNRGALVVQHAQIDGTDLGVRAGGQVEWISGKPVIDVQGEARYDHEKLIALAHAFMLDSMPQDFVATGKGIAPFSLRGPIPSIVNQRWHVPRSFDAGFEFKVDSLKTGDLNFGEAEVAGRLRNGILAIRPLAVAVNQGTLRISPVIDLQTRPTLELRNSSLSKLELSEPRARTLIGYAAPLLADAARLQGQASIYIDRARIPLDQPALAHVEGVCQIHNATATPGPLAHEFSSMIGQVQSALSRKPMNLADAGDIRISEQAVRIRMANGSVFHDNLEVMVKNTPVRTRGSININQRLSLVAQVPIKDKWLSAGGKQTEQLLGSLRGRTIDVPVEGTLSRPHVDRSFVANLARQATGSAVENLLRDQVGSKLKNVFEKLK